MGLINITFENDTLADTVWKYTKGLVVGDSVARLDGITATTVFYANTNKMGVSENEFLRADFDNGERKKLGFFPNDELKKILDISEWYVDIYNIINHNKVYGDYLQIKKDNNNRYYIKNIAPEPGPYTNNRNRIYVDFKYFVRPKNNLKWNELCEYKERYKYLAHLSQGGKAIIMDENEYQRMIDANNLSFSDSISIYGSFVGTNCYGFKKAGRSQYLPCGNANSGEFSFPCAYYRKYENNKHKYVNKIIMPWQYYGVLRDLYKTNETWLMITDTLNKQPKQYPAPFFFVVTKNINTGKIELYDLGSIEQYFRLNTFEVSNYLKINELNQYYYGIKPEKDKIIFNFVLNGHSFTEEKTYKELVPDLDNISNIEFKGGLFLWGKWAYDENNNYYHYASEYHILSAICNDIYDNYRDKYYTNEPYVLSYPVIILAPSDTFRELAYFKGFLPYDTAKGITENGLEAYISKFPHYARLYLKEINKKIYKIEVDIKQAIENKSYLTYMLGIDLGYGHGGYKKYRFDSQSKIWSRVPITSYFGCTLEELNEGFDYWNWEKYPNVNLILCFHSDGKSPLVVDNVRIYTYSKGSENQGLKFKVPVFHTERKKSLKFRVVYPHLNKKGIKFSVWKYDWKYIDRMNVHNVEYDYEGLENEPDYKED